MLQTPFSTLVERFTGDNMQWASMFIPTVASKYGADVFHSVMCRTIGKTETSQNKVGTESNIST